MVTAVIVVANESIDLSCEIAGQIIMLQQNAVLECLMPAFDLARVRVESFSKIKAMFLPASLCCSVPAYFAALSSPASCSRTVT